MRVTTDAVETFVELFALRHRGGLFLGGIFPRGRWCVRARLKIADANGRDGVSARRHHAIIALFAFAGAETE